MTKKERLQLPAVRLGARGQHLDMSPLAKSRAFSKFGKPGKGPITGGSQIPQQKSNGPDYRTGRQARHVSGQSAQGKEKWSEKDW